jgi:hypothetical protein
VSTKSPATSPHQILDTFSTAAAAMLYRGATEWQATGAGANGNYLKINNSIPEWVPLSIGPGDPTSPLA